MCLTGNTVGLKFVVNGGGFKKRRDLVGFITNNVEKIGFRKHSEIKKKKYLPHTTRL